MINLKSLALAMCLTAVSGITLAQAPPPTLPPVPPPVAPVQTNLMSPALAAQVEAILDKEGVPKASPARAGTLNGMSKWANANAAAASEAYAAAGSTASWGSALLAGIGWVSGAAGVYYGIQFFQDNLWAFSGDPTTALLHKLGVSLPEGSSLTAIGTMGGTGFWCMYTPQQTYSYHGETETLCPGDGEPVCGADAFTVVRSACHLPTNTTVFGSSPKRWMIPNYNGYTGNSFPVGYESFVGPPFGTGWNPDNYLYAYRVTSLPEGYNPACDASAGGACLTPDNTCRQEDGTLCVTPTPTDQTLPEIGDALDDQPLDWDDVMDLIGGLPPDTPANMPYGDNALSAPVDAAIIAFLANQLWRQTYEDLERDYVVAPYPYSNPITEADVQQYYQDYPQMVPRVGDLLAPLPAVAPGVTPNPYQLPSGPPSPMVSPNPVPTPDANPQPGPDTVEVDFGPDPGIGWPSLETIPTPYEILEPILNMMPDLKNYVVPPHAGACPDTSFHVDYLNADYDFDEMCQILDEYQSVIASIMMLVFFVTALFIILSA